MPQHGGVGLRVNRDQISIKRRGIAHPLQDQLRDGPVDIRLARRRETILVEHGQRPAGRTAQIGEELRPAAHRQPIIPVLARHLAQGGIRPQRATHRAAIQIFQTGQPLPGPRLQRVDPLPIGGADALKYLLQRHRHDRDPQALFQRGQVNLARLEAVRRRADPPDPRPGQEPPGVSRPGQSPHCLQGGVIARRSIDKTVSVAGPLERVRAEVDPAQRIEPQPPAAALLRHSPQQQRRADLPGQGHEHRAIGERGLKSDPGIQRPAGKLIGGGHGLLQGGNQRLRAGHRQTGGRQPGARLSRDLLRQRDVKRGARNRHEADGQLLTVHQPAPSYCW